jgi:dienelactone hydrolase
MITISSVERTASGAVFGGGLAADPSSRGRRPGVLVFHGGAGLGEHERERAKRLAEVGYIAFAPDLFGQTFESKAQGMAAIGALLAQPSLLRGRVNAALGWLRAQPNVDAERMGAIGFCFGGLAALELARSGADVRAVVSFHGGLGAREPALRGKVASKILVCTGSADLFVPREQRTAFEDEMTAANADWNMIVHGGAQHGFTESSAAPRPGCAYHEGADLTSWRAMRGLLEESFVTG